MMSMVDRRMNKNLRSGPAKNPSVMQKASLVFTIVGALATVTSVVAVGSIKMSSIDARFQDIESNLNTKFAILTTRMEEINSTTDMKIASAQKSAVKEALDEYLKYGFLHSVKQIRTAEKLAVENLRLAKQAAKGDISDSEIAAILKIQLCEENAAEKLRVAEHQAVDKLGVAEQQAVDKILNAEKYAGGKLQDAEVLAGTKLKLAEETAGIRIERAEENAVRKIASAELANQGATPPLA
jgi:hypothetical protein